MDLQKKLIANLASVPFILGGGTHGYNDPILLDTKYFRETINRFVTPVFSGTTPTILAGTAVQQEKFYANNTQLIFKNGIQ